jgi:predicted GNAT family N-acyltransferase
VRTRVFVDEQGVPPEIEHDDADATAVHAVSRDEAGRIVATGRLVERDGRAVIGRMAADPAARGRGHGVRSSPSWSGRPGCAGSPRWSCTPS